MPVFMQGRGFPRVLNSILKYASKPLFRDYVETLRSGQVCGVELSDVLIPIMLSPCKDPYPNCDTPRRDSQVSKLSKQNLSEAILLVALK